jgi:hypothetical protein
MATTCYTLIDLEVIKLFDNIDEMNDFIKTILDNREPSFRIMKN